MTTKVSLAPLWREINDIRRLGFFRLVFEALLTGSASGCVICLFRLGYTEIAHVIQSLSSFPFSSLLLFLLLTFFAIAEYFLLTCEPIISGSGIPQVELIVRGFLPSMQWMRTLFCKFTATILSLSSGLSVGREGPCIMLGASTGQGVNYFLRSRRNVSQARFLIGGSVAGMAAAFGAPLAGLFFAFEEMKTVITVPLLLFCCLSALASYAVTSFGFGFGLVFPFVACEPLTLFQYALLLPLSLFFGFFSAFYNTVLIGVLSWFDRLHLPLLLRLLPIFWLSGIVLLFFPLISGTFGQDALLLETLPYSFHFVCLLICAKLLFSAISFAAGVSGGILMPLLMEGAFLGAFWAGILEANDLILPSQQGTVLLLSMGALFAGVVRAPLTGSFLLLEMTGSFVNAPSCIALAMGACFIANRLKSVPVYDSLKLRILRLRKEKSASAHEARKIMGK